MDIPIGFDDKIRKNNLLKKKVRKNKVCKLEKSLNGLKQR